MGKSDQAQLDRVRIKLARLIFEEDITVGQLYEAVGVDISNADEGPVERLCGILDGWNNLEERPKE